MRERILQVFAYLHTSRIQKISLSLFFIGILLLAPAKSDAQDPNIIGDCITAFDAGTLLAGNACPPPGTLGITTINLDNTGAIEGAPAITCIPLPGNSADVWTTFVASSTALQFEMTGLLQNHIIVYEGIDCSSLNSLGCATLGAGNSFLLNGITPGNTYFVEAFGGDLMDTGPFTLTVTSINTPEDCASSCDIGPLTPPNACPPLTSSVHNFTLSNVGASEDNANSCGALPNNAADIWVNFMAPPATTSMIIDVSGLAQTNFIVYEGSACGGLTVLDCSQGPAIIVTNVTAGNNYYVEVFGGDISDVSSAIAMTVTTVGLSEDCFIACDLGQLNPPGACPVPGVATSQWQLSNIGAFPSPNYPIHPDCVPAGGVSADVWFSFVAASNQVNVNITGSGGAPWASAYITLYSGGCSSLSPEECTIGPGTFAVTAGEIYYLQISGPDVNTQDDFTLTLGSTRDCNTCVTSDDFTASPGPNNGKYQNGDVVQFCYNLSSWDVSQGTNWVHAIVPIFGTGWDLSTITPILPIASCGTEGGAWGWYNTPWVATISGNTFPPPAFNTAGAFAFEHTGAGSTPGNDPNNPGDNWGDACGGNININVCWTIQVADCPPVFDGEDLSVGVAVYADFQSGDWTGAGCVGTSDVERDVNYTAVCCNIPDPNLTLVQPETCVGACDGSLTVFSSNPGPRNYIWFDASGNEVFVDNLNSTGSSTATGLCPGTYTVREDDPTSFCSGTSNMVTITPGNPPPIVSFVDNSICFDPLVGPTVNLNFLQGTAPFTINYNEGGIPNTIVLGPGSTFPANPSTSTLITITSVTDGNGCTNNTPTSILLSPGPSVNITPPNANFCENSTLNLTANGTGGAGGLNYLWSDQNNFLYFGQTITISDPGTYTVTVTDANNCEIQTSTVVNQTAAPTAMPSAASFSICESENISLLGATSTPGTVTQYHWTGQNGYESFDQNPIIPTGTYPVGVGYQFCLDVIVDNGSLACPSLPQCILVDIKPIPDANISYATYCPDETVVIELFGTTFTTGNSGNVQQFHWTGPLGYESFVQNPVDATESGVYYLDIMIDGCAATQVFEVIEVPEIPEALIGANGMLGTLTVDYCEGEPTQLNADFSTISVIPSNGVTYSWSGPGSYTSNVQNPTDITESGLYSVTVDANYGNGVICPSQNVAFIVVTIAPSTPPDLDPIMPLCESDAAVALNNTQSTITGVWSGSGVSGGQFNPTGLGSMMPVILTFTPDPGQCSRDTTLEVTVVPTPVINFTPASDYCVDQTTSSSLSATPAGGTWTGDVAADGSFTPSTLGVGTGYTATYTYTDATANCTASDMIMFDVIALPTVAIDAVGGFCEADNTVQTLSASPTGGTWTGNVASDGSFTPSTLGAGTGYTATYTYTDPTTNCSNMDQVNFAVETTPTIAITDPGALCVDNNTLQQLVANPSGGSWTGDVAPDGSFTPSTLGVGTGYTATYTYSDASGICTNSGMINFDIEALPTVNIAAPGNFCVDNMASQSLSGSPLGGTWTGDVAADGSFTPSTLGVGTGYTATYTYTDPNTFCANTNQVNFDVEAIPTVDITMPGSFCASDNSMQNLMATPAGGTWTGDVAADGSFTPSTLGAGNNYNATYNYTDPTTQCENTAQVAFAIESIPTIAIDAVGNLCADDNSMQQLTATPVGGTWTGDVAPDGSFTPSTLGAGNNYSATYTYSDASGICTNSDLINFSIAAQPAISFTAPGDYCSDDNSMQQLSATPAGGIWTGDVATNGTFNPNTLGAGNNYTATYTYTDPTTNCQNTDLVNFDILDLPTVSINTPTDYCADDMTTQSLVGNPTGGTWSGDVAADGSFVPSTLGLGNNFNATYTYTDPTTNCENTEQVTFVIQSIPTIAIDAVGTYCGDDNGSQQLTASPAGGTWSGDVAADGTFTPSNLGAGGPYNATYSFTSAGGCDNTGQVQFDIEALPTINITMPGILCASDNGVQQLSANPVGGTWSGDVQSDGTFTPSNLGTGANHVATYTYTTPGTNCSSTEQIQFAVEAAPTADFVVDSPICSNGMATVTYMGSAATDANYTWNFNGGTAVGTGSGPYEVEWATAGVYNVSLDIEQNGCISSQLIQQVTVDAPLAEPVINCNTTTNSITFEWNPVNGATSYIVNGTPQAGTTIDFPGLNPGDQVMLEVIAVGVGACGNSVATTTCTAENCPPVTIDMPVVSAVCLDASATAFDLPMPTVNGSVGAGSGAWTGSGITNSAVGTFDPNMANLGSNIITYTYTEGPCTFNNTVEIVVNQQPTADFTASSVICVNDTILINYTGNATLAADYVWDFGGGQVVSGTGAGPYEVFWTTGTPTNIGLVVTENNCASEPGTQGIQIDEPMAEPMISCNSSTSFIDFSWAPVTGATGYIVNGTLQAGTTFSFTGLNAGDQRTVEVIAVGTGACGNSVATLTCSADNCPPVNIILASPANDICLDATATEIQLTVDVQGSLGTGAGTWSGSGITNINTGTFDPNAASFGPNTITYTYVEGPCTTTETIDIIINEQPIASFDISSPLCVGDMSTITFTGNALNVATYTWDFAGGTIVSGTGAGPYDILWSNPGNQNVTLSVLQNGCASTLASETVVIESELLAPVINCNTSTTSVGFSWDPVVGATGYLVNGTPQLDPNIDFNGLNTGDQICIDVEAIGTGACGNSMMTQLCCNAENCATVGITLTSPLTEVCLDGGTAPFQLTATLAGGSATAVESWSGSGIVDATQGVFDPAAANIGSNIITYTYTDGPCVFNEPIEIIVNAQPTADFTIASSICEGDQITVNYTGTADATLANFNWDFDGATIISGTGVGPYQISWPTGTAGAKTISLSVTENNCTSIAVSNNVQVDAPLEIPNISCNPSLTSIDFSWPAVVGASGYIVNGTPQAGTTFTATGLMQGESFTIQVIAVGTGACGDSSNDQTCIASDCPGFVIDFPAVDAICLDGNTGIVTLSATVTGGTGGGTGIWSGTGIVDANLGTFDPNTANIGNNLITYDYAEGACATNGTMNITVNAQPSADFTVDTPICEGDATTVTYTGTALLSSDFVWDFDGGLVQSGTGSGPYEIVWTTGGNKDIILNVAQNNCGSAPFAETVVIDAPLDLPNIDCSSTTTSVTFTWAPVAGATGYLVDGTPQAGTSFTVNGLTANDMITIEVTAIGVGACGNSVNTQTCTANDCPTIGISIDQVAPYCVDPSNPAATLVANIVGGTNGTGVWSGPGIIDANLGIFDPNDASINNGANLITFTYTEGPCVSTETTTIMVNDLPSVDAGTAPELSCNDLQVTITGNGSGLPVWTGPSIFSGETTYTPVVDQPGDYTLVVTDPATGCTSTDMITVTQDASVPMAIAGADAVIDCNNTSANLMAGGTLGADFQVTWVGPGIVNPNDENQTVTQDGQYILTIVNTMNLCVSSPDTVLVTLDTAEPIAEIIQVTSTIDCNNSSIPLSAENAANGNVTYLWNGPGGFTSTDPTINATVAGDYNVTITNPNGCEADDLSVITIDLDQPVIATSAPQSIDCSTSQVTITGTGSATGGNITYEWTGPGIVGSNNTIDIEVDAPGNYTLVVTDMDNGCSSTAPVNVAADANAPIANAGNNQELDCQENDIILSGSNSTGGNQFVWTDANGVNLSQTPTVTVNELGTYYLEVTNTVNGCVDVDSLVVFPTQNLPNALSSTIVDPSCYGENDAVIVIDTVLGGSAPYTYSLDGESFFSFNQFFNLTAGNYDLHIEDANGCNYETAITVNDPLQLTLTLTSDAQDTVTNDIILTLGDTSQSITALHNLSLGAIDTLIWSPEELIYGVRDQVDCADEDCFELLLNNIHNEAVFSATIIDTFGCSTSNLVNVRFEKERLIYIPSAFNPTSEVSENQVFMINAGAGVKSINSFNVYNRWGEVVFSGKAPFEANNPSNEYAWNGIFKGKRMNPGVFVYQVEVEFVDGEIILYSGDVTLMR